MSTYNSFPSLDSGNFRISKANPYLKSVNMPAIDSSTYFRFGKAYTPAYKNNFSWQQDLFDYNDPLAINSVVDAVFNSDAKRQRYKLGDNILADVVATVPALLELTYNSSIKPYVTNIKHAIESEEYGIGEALGNASWAGVLNTLMNVGETLDVLANPVKATVITTFTDKDRLREEGKATNVIQALKDSMGWGGRGRINYDYDMVPGRYSDGPGNVVLELISDPFNWISWGASSGIKGIAKEAVEGAVESATKTVVKEATQEAVEQASKSVAKEITQEAAERVVKEATGEVFDTLSKHQQELLVKNLKRALRDGNLDEAADIISKTVKDTLNGTHTGLFKKLGTYKYTQAGLGPGKFSDEYVDSLVNKITATTLENINYLKRAQKVYNLSEGAQKILSKSALITSAPGLIGSYKGIKYGMHAIEQHAAKLAKDAKLDTIEGIANAVAKAQEKFGARADADVRKHLIDFYQSQGYSKVVANHLTKNTIAKYTTQAARASALQYRQLVTNLAVFKSKYDDAMKTLVDADMYTRVKTLQPIYEELADTVSNAEQMLTSLKELRKTNMFSDTIEDYIKVLEDVVADAKADSPYKKTLQELISEMDDVGQRIQNLIENPRAVGTVKKYKAIQHFDSIDVEARKEVLDALNINDYASVFANTEENIISALSEMYKRNVFTITKNVETVDVQAFIEDVLDCYDILLDGANIPNKVRIILRHKAVSDEFKKLITEYVQFYFIKNKELCAQLNELLNRSGAKISDVLTDAKKLFQESDKLLSQKRAGILPALLKSVPPKYSAHHAAMQHTLPELMSKLHDIAKTNKALAHVDLHTVTGTLLIDDIDKSLGVLKVLDELRALEKSWSVEQSIEHAKDLKLKGYDYTSISRDLALPYNIRYNVQERFNNLYEMSNFKKHITAATREDVLDSIDSLTRTATNDFRFVSAEDVVKTIDLYESKAISDTFDKVYKTAKPHKDFEVPVSKLAEQVQEDIVVIMCACKEDPLFLKHLQNSAEPFEFINDAAERLQYDISDAELQKIIAALEELKAVIKDYDIIKKLQANADQYSKGAKDVPFKAIESIIDGDTTTRVSMSPATQHDLYKVSKSHYDITPEGAVEGLVSARKEAEAGIKVYAASLSKVFTSSQIRNIPEVGALVKAWANKDISNPVVELLQKYKGQITVEDSPLYHAYQTITDTLDRAVFLDEVSYKLAQIPDDALPKEIRFALVDALHSNTGSKVAAELLEDMPKFIDKLCEKARVQLLCRKSKFKYSLDAIQDTMHDMFPGNDDIVKAVQDLIDEAQKTGTNAHDALFDVKVTEALMDYVDELHTPKEFADSHIRVTFDIETTGTNPADGQLLQIAARCTIDGKAYEFNTLVKADTHVAFDLEAKLTGMKTTDRDAVTKAFEQKFMADANGNEFTGLEAFYNWLTDMQKTAGEGRNKILLCGQNIDNFDIDFIKQRLDFLTSRKANASLTNLKGMLDNADTFDTLIAYYNRDGVPYLTNVQRDFIQQTFSEYFKKLQGADWTQRIKFGEYLDGDFVSACDDFCKIIKSDEVYRYGADLATAGINETSELSKLVSDIRETFKGIRENNADYSTYRAFIGEHELNIMSRLYNLEDGQLMVSPKLLRDMRSVSAFYELPEVMSETDADILTHFVKKIKNNREYIRCSSSIKKSENFLAQVKEVIKDLIDNKGVSVPGARNTGENTARLCYEAYNDGKDCVALLKTMTYKQGSKKALVESLDTLLKEGKIDLNTYDIIRRNCDDVYNKTKLAQSAAPDVYLTDMHDTAEALEDLAKDPHKGLDAIITNRNLWSAGEASSKALLRSTCDNFKTIAKILEPMDVKEAAAITESIKNAGALFTAHQLQDLVNKTADDLLKELHLSAGVKVVHTDYKAISNEVLDAWRANGILCEEVVNDMGGTSAYTYWIVADKSKYDYAKLIELGEGNKINPVFIDDITGNAEIDRLLVDNRNTLAKHNPTLGATDGSRITDAIYSRVYAACPESLKGNLLTVEELHNAKFFDKNYCNHMVIGDAASHKQYNLLYTDDVTMSHRFNIQDAVAQQEAVIKYTECFMNSDMSLRTGALFKDLPAATKLEIIRNSEGCKVAFLAPNKHAKYGYEIRTMDVYNLKTLKLAEDVDAVILPQMTVLTMQRVVNKYEMPAIMKILTIPAMIYKCGYLGSLGFLFRNLTGGLINNTIAAGSPLELPHTIKHWFNTLKLYREYNVVCNKITALGVDAADVLHKLSDYGTVKRVITELAQNGEIKMLDPAAFMDVHKFIRHGPSAGLCESVQDTLAAFTEAAGGKQYDSVLNKAINKTAEATSNLPILKQINTANGWIEQTLRLSLYLQEVERGSSISQAIAKVIKTHFDYSTKPLYMHYAETIVPFLSFTMNNLEFYADTFNRFGWFTGTIVDAFKPNWDFDTLSDPNHKDYYSYDRGFDWGDLVSTKSKLPHGKISMARLYHTMAGNIILPTEKDADYYNGYTGEVEQRRLSNVFKLNPSFMDAFNFLTSPLSSTTERTLPYYSGMPELALKLLNGEAAVSDVELGLFFENIPIIGPVLQRTGFSDDIVGKGAENKNIIDKIKDSDNPLLAMSSLFGVMYEKPAVTYSNSNRWGGVKKYNRARYFKLTQPGTTKQGSHRSAHPSNYRKGIYDMSSKSELDKRMYIASNPNIRYRIRDYYRRYI